MTLQSIKERLLRNKKFREEYFKKNLALDIGQMLIEARVIKCKTQKQLAEDIGTKQPAIARIENGITLPSLSLLEKIAKAFESYLIPPTFGFMTDCYPNREKYVISTATPIMFFNVIEKTNFYDKKLENLPIVNNTFNYDYAK